MISISTDKKTVVIHSWIAALVLIVLGAGMICFGSYFNLYVVYGWGVLLLIVGFLML